MPYILEEFEVKKSTSIEEFLTTIVKLDSKTANSLISKGKILNHKNKRLQRNEIIKDGFIKVNIFKAITKNLKPLFDSFHFAIFDKASGIKVHPSSINNEYTLLDEIRYYFGEDASLVHRIDAETSGLVLVSKNPYSEFIFKNMFENKEYIKKYLALVEGEISLEQTIDKRISQSNGLIKIKMETSNEGKDSITKIKPLYFNKENNQTLIEASPITGRQHQIRVHLNSINHRIVGDPIYGIDENLCNKILNKKVTNEERVQITGNKRLLLQANYLEFSFLGNTYKFYSKRKL